MNKRILNFLSRQVATPFYFFYTKYYGSITLHRVLSTLRPSGVINAVPPDHDKLATLISGSSKRRSLLMEGDGRRSVYDKKHQRYAEDSRTAFNCTRVKDRQAESLAERRLRNGGLKI